MLSTNKRRTSLLLSLRVDEAMRQGLFTFDGVDEIVTHGLSPGEESIDETRAVANSLSAASKLNLIVGFTNSKVVKNKCNAGLLP